tara:strand:- start:771 stop:1013 length:243 start_codon:yes stop_codon:yes gene_type:complete
MGYACGNVLRKTQLGAGYITGVRVHKDNVYLGISGTPGSQTEVSLGDGFTKKGNIAYGAPPDEANPVGGRLKVESWREKF